jgi:hypothetical protein
MAEMVAPAAAKGKKLYARKSSGLVRTIGVFGAMVFGVHCISLSSSGLIPFSWVAGVWPGSSIIGVLTIRWQVAPSVRLWPSPLPGR